MALLVGFEDDAVAEVATRLHAQGSGNKLPKKWLQEHEAGGWVVGLLPVDGKVRAYLPRKCLAAVLFQ